MTGPRMILIHRYTVWLIWVTAIGVAMNIATAVSSCAHPPPNLSPQGRIAFTADQIVLRVGELQKAAIAAEAGGGLPTAQAKLIVQFSISAARILKETPAGWQKTVTVLWTELKTQLLLPIKDPVVAAAIGAVDALLVALIGEAACGVIRAQVKCPTGGAA